MVFSKARAKREARPRPLFLLATADETGLWRGAKPPFALLALPINVIPGYLSFMLQNNMAWH
jgi:hypothetical protein